MIYGKWPNFVGNKKKSYPETRANAPFIQWIEEILKQAFDNSKAGVKKNNTSW